MKYIEGGTQNTTTENHASCWNKGSQKSWENNQSKYLSPTTLFDKMINYSEKVSDVTKNNT